MSEPETDEDEEGPPPSVIRRAQLPPPSEVEDDKVYMVTFRSGNTVPMLGRELKKTLTTDQPPGMNLGQDSGSGDPSSDGSGNGGRVWWKDVLLGVGRIGGIFLRDRLGDGQELSEEEREALREIARRRREERLRTQRRNRFLLIGGVVVLGGIGLWLATPSSSSPAPPPPPPPEPDDPEPSDAQEPQEVEITDAERERENDALPNDDSAGEPEDLLNPDNS